MSVRWSGGLFVAVLLASAAWGGTLVTCDNLSGIASCHSGDLAGGSVSAQASESYWLSGGIFSYQSSGELRVTEGMTAGSLGTSIPAVNHQGSLSILSSFELYSDGPVRSGYLNLFGNTSQVQANSFDSSVNASASYRLTIGNGYTMTCANGYGCFIPVYEAHPIPVTLGSAIEVELIGQAYGMNWGGEQAVASLLSNMQFELFEADGAKQASINSFRVVTPEPATWMLALPCILLMILANLRVARGRRPETPDTYKRIGRRAARNNYLRQRQGLCPSERSMNAHPFTTSR